MKLAFVLFIAASPAMSCERWLACTFEAGRKSVELCIEGDTARYRFGPADGAPELALDVPVTEAELVPWPGIGSTVWEEVTLRNGDYAYTLWAAIERNLPESEDGEITTRESGGIIVARGEGKLAELSCDPGSVDFPWTEALSDAKRAAGQCYDPAERVWSACR